MTAWAQGDAVETKCPMPGMLMMVALDSFAAAAFAPASDVSVSKLPEMRSVGTLLATGWRMASGAAGTFHTSRQETMYCDASPNGPLAFRMFSGLTR